MNFHLYNINSANTHTYDLKLLQYELTTNMTFHLLEPQDRMIETP